MTTFQDLLRQHSIPTAPAHHEHSRAGWVNLDCPDCTPGSRHWRLGYNLRGKYLSCWACGYRPLIPTLAKILQLPRAEVARLVGDLPSTRTGVEDHRGTLVLPEGLGPLMGCHRDYLAGRGFDPDALVALWGIQGIGLASKLAWRVWVPFHLDGRVVSWLSRGIGDRQDLRHRSASPEEEAIDHKTLLYGEDHARHAVAVMEGYTDVWAVGPGAVATCGISYRREQVLRIAKYPRRIICYNTETQAQKRAEKLCRELKVFPGETINLTFTYKDAAETMIKKPEELIYLRRELLEQD